MARVCIVTGAHLCRNPRVVKEASALSEAGHRAVVLGPATHEDLAEEDAVLAQQGGFEHRFAVDLRPGAAGRDRHRIVRRAATEAVARLGLQRPESLGYGVRVLLAAARREQADLTIGHQEVGVYVVAQLLREGVRVGADIEDWHSEDQLAEWQRRPRRLLRASEAAVLREAAYTMTTSHALAEALAATYAAPKPAVVYNAFPWAERTDLDALAKDRPDRTLPSLHWVSQTVGPGRGLSVLFDALALVSQPVAVHLRGRVGDADRIWLDDRFPTAPGHRLFTHDLVSPAELLSRIAEHDVGLALEETEPASRNLTVTNKILHYLLGGLAVVATDTAGQVEIAERAPDAVSLCRSGDAESLAEAIGSFLSSSERLAAAKAAALRAAESRFSWEQQRPVLVRTVEQALSPVPGP
ncbi:MAG: glycosyl transferase family 1 [Bacteroidota bacterium]